MKSLLRVFAVFVVLLVIGCGDGGDSTTSLGSDEELKKPDEYSYVTIWNLWDYVGENITLYIGNYTEDYHWNEETFESIEEYTFSPVKSSSGKVDTSAQVKFNVSGTPASSYTYRVWFIVSNETWMFSGALRGDLGVFSSTGYTLKFPNEVQYAANGNPIVFSWSRID